VVLWRPVTSSAWRSVWPFCSRVFSVSITIPPEYTWKMPEPTDAIA
jgi:hypothetical protein